MAPNQGAAPNKSKSRRSGRDIWRMLTKSSPDENRNSGLEIGSTSTANNLRPQSQTPSNDAAKGSVVQDKRLPVAEPLPEPVRPLPLPKQGDEAALLWTEAYDKLSEEDADLVDAYEVVLTGQSGLSYAVAGTINMFTGCSGLRRMELMASVAREVVEKTAKHADFLDGVVTATELMATITSGVSKLLDAYPPAAMALSGLAVALPVLVTPIKAQKAMASCLKHVLDQIEWYASLSRVLLQDNWVDDGDFAQYRQTLREAVLGLYKSLLQLEMRCVCRYHNSHYVLATLKEILSLVDWEGDLKSLRDLESDVNYKIDQYNKEELAKHLRNISTNGSQMTKELKVATERMIAQNEAWRTEQAERHRHTMGMQLNTLIGKFNTTTYRSYMTRNKYMVPGTCQWFCNHKKFQRWLDPQSDPLLVVSALPGSGKSTLAHYLIEKVLPQRRPDATICYFFFKDDNQKQRETASALCAFLHRLFDEQSERAYICQDQILRYGDKLFSDPDALWEVFKTAVACNAGHKGSLKNSIICVFDALDECDPPKLYTLLERLDELLGASQKSLQIKFLVTTRPYPEIIQRIRIMDSRVLRLAGEDSEEMEKIQQEITLVVNHRLKELVKMKNLDADTEKVIRRSMQEKGSSQRTYLWVKLVFEVLEYNFDDSPDEWIHLIDNLPQTIFETYEKLLRRVKGKDKGFVRLLISLVFTANRPLSLREMNIAIECRNNINAREIPYLCSDDAFRTRVIDACGFFITSYKNRLFFIHQTAREFLQSKTINKRSDEMADKKSDDNSAAAPAETMWQASVTSQLAHRAMAESCIAYLSLRSVRSLELSRLLLEAGFPGSQSEYKWRDILLIGSDSRNGNEHTAGMLLRANNYLQKRFEFFCYAIANWTDHFRRAQVLDGAELVEDVGEKFIDSYLSLFNSKIPFSLTWAAASLDVFNRVPSWVHESILDNRHTLADMGPYIAVACGHIRPLKEARARHWTFPYIFAHGLDWNNPQRRGNLSDIAECLINWAIRDTSGIALTYLVDIYPHAPPLLGGWGLRDTYDDHHPAHSAVLVLIERGANINIVEVFEAMRYCDLQEKYWNFQYSTALRPALGSFSSLRIQHELVELLLEHGAVVSARSAYKITPLHNLVLRRRANLRDLVKILLDYGANINALDNLGRLPLLTMCMRSIEQPPRAVFVDEAIEELTDLGADPSLQGDGGYAPLHVVAARGMAMSVLALLRVGAYVESRTACGHTPLHLACMTFVMYLYEGAPYLKWSRLRLNLPFWNSKEARHYRMSELLHKCCPPLPPPTPGNDDRTPSPSTKSGGEDFSFRDQTQKSAEFDHESYSPSQSDVGPQRPHSQQTLDPSEEKYSFTKTTERFPYEGSRVVESAIQDDTAPSEPIRSSYNILSTGIEQKDRSDAQDETCHYAKRKTSNYTPSVKTSSSQAASKPPSTSHKLESNRQQSYYSYYNADPLSMKDDDDGATFRERYIQSGAPANDEPEWAVNSTVRASVIEHLVAAGADINAQDDEGCTPLHWAALAGDLFLVEVLVRRLGAKAYARNHGGQTALHLACCGNSRLYGRSWLVDEKEEAEAVALRRGIVGLLVDRGIDAGFEDQKGRKAGELATRYGEEGMGEFLEERVAARRMKDREEKVVEVGDELEERVAKRLKDDIMWQPTRVEKKGLGQSQPPKGKA